MWLSWLRPLKAVSATITFPNQSRSYDATQRGVRFWGYDRSMETSFLITANALRRIVPGIQSEATDLLHVFDANRERIYAIAAKVYARDGRGFSELVAADVF